MERRSFKGVCFQSFTKLLDDIEQRGLVEPIIVDARGLDDVNFFRMLAQNHDGIYYINRLREEWQIEEVISTYFKDTFREQIEVIQIEVPYFCIVIRRHEYAKRTIEELINSAFRKRWDHVTIQ